MQKVMRSVRNFFRRDKGSMTVEAVLMLPLLIFAYGGMFVLWDAVKTKNTTQNAAYTISDMISRQPTGINDQFVDGLYTMLQFLTYGKHESKLRVTVVESRIPDGGTEPELFLLWSENRGGWFDITDIRNVEDAIPPVALNDRAILVETEMNYTPLFEILGLGMTQEKIYNFVVTRPRANNSASWSDADSGTSS